MELWIRSQDKEQLVKVDEVYIEEILDTTVFITNKYNVGEWLIQCNDTILGVYKTKESALEILDEIQRILIPKGIIKFDSLLEQEDIKTLRKHFDNNYTVVNKNVELLQPFETLVYEMPKE